MSLADEWDHELQRAEAVLEDEDRRFGHLRLVPVAADEPPVGPEDADPDAPLPD